MSTETEYMKFLKPAGSDAASPGAFNANMDKIDNKFKEVDQRMTTSGVGRPEQIFKGSYVGTWGTNTITCTKDISNYKYIYVRTKYPTDDTEFLYFLAVTDLATPNSNIGSKQLLLLSYGTQFNHGDRYSSASFAYVGKNLNMDAYIWSSRQVNSPMNVLEIWGIV